MTHHFAVIDLGSNSARMTIWSIDQEVVKPVKRLKEMVRLSEDMGTSRTLQPAAMDRTLKALQGFKAELDKYEDISLKAVATAAVRQAKNQKAFLKRVKNEAGLTISVIPGMREAEYDFLGVVNTLPIQNALIMDTGGASTELVLVQNRKLQHLVSIPFGSVNLSERFLSPDVISAAEYFSLSTFIHQTFNSVWWLRRAQNLPIVALGGSNRTLAKIERRKEKLADFEAIHGYRMPTQQANNIFKEILSSDLATREAIPGLAKYRADIIVGGLVPVISMIRYLDSDRLTFSQFGLREGALYGHLNSRAVAQREH
ncbi:MULTISPECIES: exopolyphosphatase [Lacticaseibacillus]|uniref:exopolyphosphatase n=1 Tax=Lacticaseibacillus casei DSM 20011 = JCM 1134 = ATCC 393 TaxID=1423732 RepID=A0AAD1ART5_LACCA|nr:exopolyphosphatase [Lacticaseibacillus casei]HAJ55763.1 exopolyphosphatase [Lactobacillus sp.]MBI6597371.1 exopolyphosphatase [Lacticaseibacillus casei]MBO1481042.1 exopolyphosphatase [Lacticaseibacillus casei]MBO2416347.1 exopolyphosphatase [Lacticaseibacillus casei]MCK2080723.1 exopolyphosphatase [Lacticaseibacillus casei]